VLALLLEGSHFNYVLLGSPRNPNVLDKVVLIAKTGPDDVAPPPQSKEEPGVKPESRIAAQPEEEMAVEEGTNDVAPTETQADNGENDQQAPAVEGQQPPVIKTPEQLLQELQRQQQIMQQSQPGRPAPPQPPQQ
ncbi:MAG: hypothetical protein JOY93_07375, partial [Acidobacteriales bacterium]|nr:hypothetical protein [Terriglobales bacterium]